METLTQINKAENGIVFQIESLDLPAKLAEEKSLKEIVKSLNEKAEFIPRPEKSFIPGGFHSFLYGAYLAYSEHRPFTISPDMIWLLFLQGFSNHVNFSFHKGINLLPQLDRKQLIVVRNDKIEIGNPRSPWWETTGQFVEEVEKKVGKGLMGALKANFSTTKMRERIVSEITILDSMKPYFYNLLTSWVCGIPEIKLEGQPDDWGKIIRKMNRLRRYDMAWWVDELIPVIKEIKRTSEGSVKKDFWKNFFKIHTKESYGDPKSVDGWITKFYPYDRHGKRTNFKERRSSRIEDIFEELPKEMVAVPFEFRKLDLAGNFIGKTGLEYWGGFLGMEQDRETFNIRPAINWFVAHESDRVKVG